VADAGVLAQRAVLYDEDGITYVYATGHTPEQVQDARAACAARYGAARHDSAEHMPARGLWRAAARGSG
jgi:hypothetical protein